MSLRSTDVRDRRSDRLFAEPEGRPLPFAFDERVVAVFEDMIERSVPGYRTIIEATGLFAARHIKPDTRAYDLGCSLGAGLLAMLGAVSRTDFELFGIDSSRAMIERCRQILKREVGSGRVVLLEEDLRGARVENASFVAMNFTLQFIPSDERLAILRGLKRGMLPGGALLLSEKISHTCADNEAHFSELHEDFKRLQGYSDLEIANKRAALDRVLTPEPLEVHEERLARAGFRSSRTWFRCMNFASILAQV